jgi:ATP-dependent RNA helicase RhlE
MSLSFSNLPLAPALLRAVEAAGYTQPTPIQAQAIPLISEGRDLLGLAQTGTGKTAAFVLPLLQRLSARPAPGPGARPSALILAPTRELALQIGDCVTEYGAGLHRRHAVIFGGVGAKPQIEALRRGLDIVVATPGRLLDLIGGGYARLDAVDYLVLDEADRLLDMGFLPDVRRILGRLPAKRQSLMFSATMPRELEMLAREMLRDPERIDIAPESVAVERIEQRVVFVDSGNKLRVLTDLLRDDAVRSAIIFTRTKHRANRVAEQLEAADISAEAIHGNKSQNARQRALGRFREGKAWVLVATDIAARGIDIDGITHIFNFELPNEPESYVHRIGRTARAGAEGVAVSLCDAAERSYLRSIERLVGRQLEVVQHPLSSTRAPAPEVRRAAARASDSGARGDGAARRSNGAAPHRGAPRHVGASSSSGTGRSNGAGRSSNTAHTSAAAGSEAGANPRRRRRPRPARRA